MKERAVDAMVASGEIPALIGQKIKADVFQVVDVYNNFGEKTGQQAIVDKSNPNAPMSMSIDPRNSPARSRGTPFVVGPQHMGPDGKTVNLDTVTPSKSKMFLGVGHMPAFVSLLSSVVETFDPSASTPMSRTQTTREQQLYQARAALTSIANSEAGRQLAGMWNAWGQLLPQPGLFTEPPNKAVDRGIQLVQQVETLIAEQEEAIKDAGPGGSGFTSQAQAKQASELWRSLNRFRNTLPSMQELESVRKALEQGTSGAISGADAVAEGFRGLGSMGRSALTIGQQNRNSEVPPGTSEAPDVGGSKKPQQPPPGDRGAAEVDRMNKMDPRDLKTFEPQTLAGKQEKLRRLRVMQGGQ